MEGPGGQSARGLAVGPESGRAVLPGPANTALAMRPSARFGLAPRPLSSFPFAWHPLVGSCLCPSDAGRLVSTLRPWIPGGPGVLRSGYSWSELALPPGTARAMARPGQEGRRGRAARLWCGPRKELPFTLGLVASSVFAGEAPGGLRRSAAWANATSFPDVSPQLSFNPRVPGGWRWY